MKSVESEDARRRRRLTVTVKDSLRELGTQLAQLNQQVSARVDLKGADFACLGLIGQHGSMTPSTLARRAGVHPATLTGILDRLERAGWIARERDPADRRAVLIHAQRDRAAELFGLYAGMSTAMDTLCADYTEAELRLIAGFLDRTTQAGQEATTTLADGA
jgi:DNA-binding MarR family transcriptional regulator